MAMNLWAPSVSLPQRDTAELLDSRVYSRVEVERSLRDVARINSFLGATKPLYDAVWKMVDAAQLRKVMVLDVGCGNSDFARRLIEQGHKRGVDIRVVALDISDLHLDIARELTTPDAPVDFVRGDAFEIPFQDSGVDIVTSTLFLHHFRAEQIRRLLEEFCRVARVGWIMNDCTRDAVALWSFRLLRPFLARSFITRFDAVASTRRAYTPDELREVISPIYGARVQALFPYRLQAEWTKTV